MAAVARGAEAMEEEVTGAEATAKGAEVVVVHQ